MFLVTLRAHTKKPAFSLYDMLLHKADLDGGDGGHDVFATMSAVASKPGHGGGPRCVLRRSQASSRVVLPCLPSFRALVDEGKIENSLVSTQFLLLTRCDAAPPKHRAMSAPTTPVGAKYGQRASGGSGVCLTHPATNTLCKEL